MVAAALALSMGISTIGGVLPTRVHASDEVSVERIAGSNRYETSAMISQKLFDEVEKVVIASGEDFPDALSAGVYANAIDAPILLVPKKGGNPAIDAEIKRLHTKEAVVVGGESAIASSNQKVDLLVERIYGENRYETSRKISERLEFSKVGYASGGHFADAISAIPLLTKERMPLLLFQKGEALNGNGYVFGGESRIASTDIGGYTRISGQTRYGTSVETAKNFGNFSTVIIASGEAFPDALSSSALSKRYNAPILLTPKKGLSAEVLDYLMEKRVTNYIIVGGESAVSDKVEWQLKHILNADTKYSLLTSPVAKGQYAKEVKDAVALYYKEGRTYHRGMRDYNHLGPSVDFYSTSHYQNTEYVEFDEHRNPRVRYSGKYYYNPVTLGQYALGCYAEYLNKERDSSQFLTTMDKLLDYMSDDGAFRYEFSWYNGNTREIYHPGWTSALAQGHALSCFSRAYELTKDPKYIEGGNKVFSYLMLEKEKGGLRVSLGDLDPSLSENIFFEEYVSTPNSYTLNGYMFTLLGIYDWSRATASHPQAFGANDSAWAFKEGIESLQYILHLYDMGGFTNYDLGFMNYRVAPRLFPGYHALHIQLLRAVYSITGVKQFHHFEELWRSYL